ncbi:MAG: hypothetical protein IJV71_03285, partial [Lachnospiraceae bacterium]|nr:hypothetical protein [Lachnospiraceae bacterium]
MVILKKIKKVGEIISCSYHPEGTDACGYISINAITGDVVEEVHSNFPGAILFSEETYANYAKKRLLELREQTPLPETSTVMWY